MKVKVVVIGGGPSGFSAAMTARKVGAEVTVIERTDALGGLGMVAGIGMGYSARSVYTEERALGGADLVNIFETIATHNGIRVPGVGDDVLLYNVTRLDAQMQRALQQAGVTGLFKKTVIDASFSGNKVESVLLQDGTSIGGDVFIDCTGATNGPTDCNDYGRGCVDCIYRCPMFGAPGGIIEKRVNTVARLNAYNQPGVSGVSVLVAISSLSPKVQQEVTENGFALIPVPPNAKFDEDRMKRAGAPESFREDLHKRNIILLDVGGYVKVTALGSPMWAGSLRSFPGLEDAWIAQPAAGKVGHMIHSTTMAYRDNSLKVTGLENVFCAGYKAGLFVSLADAIVTGDLAGYNAVRWAVGMDCLELPKSLMIGSFIDYTGRMVQSEEGRHHGYGVHEPKILKSLNVFRENRDEIINEVEKAGLKEIYQARLT